MITTYVSMLVFKALFLFTSRLWAPACGPCLWAWCNFSCYCVCLPDYVSV